MRVPITGIHDIDALTVRSIIAAGQAHRLATAKLAGLTQTVQGLQGRAWARRQRAKLLRGVKAARVAVADRVGRWTPPHPHF